MRYVFVVVGLLVLLGGLAGIKGKQIGSLIASGKEFQKAGPPPESVSTQLAETQTWEGTLSAVGSIAAAKGVAVSNEVPGTVVAIRFESGAVVRQGQVLAELDSSVERAQLASIKARRELAQVSLGRTRALVGTNSVPQAQLDNDESALKTVNADIGALEAQIDRKTVRAPFGGRLGIRQVNLGQYLNPGTTLTVLEAIDSVYADFSLPQQRLADLKVGMPVRLDLEGVAADAGRVALPDGAISAIDPTIDATTRTIKVRAAVPNKDERLRPGMFVKCTVVLPSKLPSVTVPATSLVHASYGDSVFIVQDKKDPAGVPVMGADGKPAKMARQQFVRVGEARGDWISVLDGVTAGQEVVATGAFKLRNGAGVVINNSVKLTPDVAPHPENR